MDIHLKPEDIAKMPKDIQAQLTPEPVKPLESNLPAWLQGVPLEHRAHLAEQATKRASVPVRPVRASEPPVPVAKPFTPAEERAAEEAFRRMNKPQPVMPPPPPSPPRIVETPAQVHRVEIRNQVPPYLIIMLGFSLLATLLLALALILLALK